MNSALIIQAARGPLLLITLGALIVIDYHTHFRFNQTWPVLIIVFGILKLMERIAGPPPAPYAPPPPTPGFQQGTGFQQPPPPQDLGGNQP
jgi:hypothetical protein